MPTAPPPPPPPPPRRPPVPEARPAASLLLPLDADLEVALDRLVTHLSSKPDVAKLGLVVTRLAAARAALLSGVEALLSPAAVPVAVAASVAVANPTSPAAVVPSALSMDLVSSATTATQAGQAPCPNWMPAQAPVGAEAELHLWYTSRGWQRFVATTPRGPMIIYWAPVEIHRPLCADSFDAYIQAVAVEGYGLVHVIPRDWAATRSGADTAEAKEAGTTPELRQAMGPGQPGKATVLG